MECGHKRPAHGSNRDKESVSCDENGKWIDPENSKMEFTLSAIDELIMNLPKKTVLGVFSQLIFEMMNHSDWKHKHCALMCLSQSFEYMEDITQFDPIVNTILVNALQHEHPKVRYAALLHRTSR